MIRPFSFLNQKNKQFTMKITSTSLLLILLLISCSKKTDVKNFSFDSFVFSYAGLHHDNSIKFNNSDTIFLQRRYPEPKENFYAIINGNIKEKLYKHLQSLNVNKFKSEYSQNNLCDGSAYLLNISNNNKNKSIFVYGHTAPKELFNFIDSLSKFKDHLKFIPTKQVIDFGDLSTILPPPPPPPLKTKTE